MAEASCDSEELRDDIWPVMLGVSESWLDSILTASDELVTPFVSSTIAASWVLEDLLVPSVRAMALIKLSLLSSTPNRSMREASLTLASVEGRLIEARWEVTSFTVSSLTAAAEVDTDADAVAVAAVVVACAAADVGAEACVWAAVALDDWEDAVWLDDCEDELVCCVWLWDSCWDWG